ncbi:MAG: glycosyltransferase family 4 protein [bacterium]|jgi:glycosyltransferase involved in cell wall biosynthesis
MTINENHYQQGKVWESATVRMFQITRSVSRWFPRSHSDTLVFLNTHYTRSGQGKVIEIEKPLLEQHGYSSTQVAHSIDRELSHLPLEIHPQSSPAWIGYFHREQPRAVIAHDLSRAQIYASLCRVPWIQVLRNCPAWIPPARVQVTRQFLQNADDIWVVSHTVRDYMEQVFQVEPERMRVIPGPIQVHPWQNSLEKRALVREQYEIPRDTRLLLYAGRMIPEKCILELVKAYDLLQRRHYEIRLVLIGSGDPAYEQKINDLINMKSLQYRVYRVPWTTNLASWYSASDLFVLPSMLEGSSLTAGEALVSGLPCVLTRTGDAEELSAITGAVVLFKPSQGTSLDIHPGNYHDLMNRPSPDYPEEIAQAIEQALMDYPRLIRNALANKRALTRLRAPEQIVGEMVKALRAVKS